MSIFDTAHFDVKFSDLQVVNTVTQDNSTLTALIDGSLTDLEIPDGTTKIGSYLFYHSNITSFVIPDSVTSIEDHAFQACTSLSEITIPDSVTSIGTYAFSSCKTLLSITLPNNITRISSYTFYNATALTTINFPDNLVYLDTYAFYNCNSLTNIIIPDGVIYIGSNAFYNCTSMQEYHLRPTTPPTLGSSAFTNIPSTCIIYVPQGCLEAYLLKTAWSVYADYMQEEPDEES